MSSPVSEKKEYTLLQLLTEVGAIIMKIKEKAKLDERLPKDPMNLVGEALKSSNNEEKLQENLKKEALKLSKQKIEINAQIDYISILARVSTEKKVPLEKYGYTITVGEKIEEE